MALLATGNTRAERDNHLVDGPKELPATQIGKTTFFKEDEPPTKQEQLAVRGVLTEAKVAYTADKEGGAISGLVQHLLDLAAHAGGPAPLPAPPDTSHLAGIAALAGNQQVRAVAEQAERLRQDIRTWSSAGEQRAARESTWRMLERLLQHAAQMDTGAQVRAQRDAVQQGRLLMESPDPIEPLIRELSDALRAAVLNAAAGAIDDQAKALRDLEASAEWQQLDTGGRDALLVSAGLAVAPTPAVSSDEELLKALDETPLTVRKERRQAIPAKVAAARAAAARQLEPKAVTMAPASATLRTPAEVEAYVTALWERLLQHVTDGDTVII